MFASARDGLEVGGGITYTRSDPTDYETYSYARPVEWQQVRQVAELTGGFGELALTGGIEATVQDFTIGWPGLLLQVIGAYLICKFL